MQEEDVIGVLSTDDIGDLKPLGDRILIEVSHWATLLFLVVHSATAPGITQGCRMSHQQTQAARSVSSKPLHSICHHLCTQDGCRQMVQARAQQTTMHCQSGFPI